MAEIDIEQLDLSTSNKSVRELTQGLKSLEQAYRSGEIGLEEYTAASVEYAGALDDANKALETAKISAKGFEGTMQNLTGALAGISAAGGVVTGTFNLLGIENEELQKKMDSSITSLIAITQGFQTLSSTGVDSFKRLVSGVKSGTTAFKGLKVAIAGTGIGLLIIAIAAVVEHFEEFKTLIGLTDEKMAKLKDTWDKTLLFIRRSLRAAVTVAYNIIETTVNNIKTIGTSIKKLFTGDFKGAIKNLTNFVNPIKAIKNAVKEAAEEWDNAFPEKDNKGKGAKVSLDSLKKALNEYNEAMKDTSGTLESYKAKLEALNKLLTEIAANQVGAKILKIDPEELQASKELLENQIQAKELELERQEREKAFNEEIAKFKSSSNAYKENLSPLEKDLRILDELLIKYPEYAAQILELYAAVEERHAELNDIANIESFNAQIDNIINSNKSQNEVLEEQIALLEEAIKKYPELATSGAAALDILNKKQKAYNNEVKDNKTAKIFDYIARSAETVAAVTGSLADLFAENEKAAKSFGAIEIIANTAAGVTRALSGAFTFKATPLDAILAVSQAAAIAIGGAAQFKNLMSERIGNDGVSELAAANTLPSVDVSTAVESRNTTFAPQAVLVVEDFNSVDRRVQVNQSNNRF